MSRRFDYALFATDVTIQEYCKTDGNLSEEKKYLSRKLMKYDPKNFFSVISLELAIDYAVQYSKVHC